MPTLIKLPATPAPIRFTLRSREILEMICLGWAPKHIAADLGISITTVNTHIVSICRKAGVARSELVLFGLQNDQALTPHGSFMPGLHPADCPCESALCSGRRRHAA